MAGPPLYSNAITCFGGRTYIIQPNFHNQDLVEKPLATNLDSGEELMINIPSQHKIGNQIRSVQKASSNQPQLQSQQVGNQRESKLSTTSEITSSVHIQYEKCFWEENQSA